MEPTYYSSQRRELHKFLPGTVGRLLDVGCSEGGYGAAVRQLHPNAEVWGVEPVKSAAVVAAQRLNHVVNELFRDDLELPDHYFDVITFNDSLEHMIDEYAALKIAHRKLRTGGILICTVPNVRFLENIRHLLVDADWQYADNGVLDRTHLRFFTRRSICRAINESGFSIDRVEGINPHWWTGWKVNLLRMIFRRHIEDMRWQQFVVVARRSS